MDTRAIAYRPSWRIVAAALIVISRGSPLVLLAALTFLDTRLTNQLRLMRAFFTFCLAPGIAAWLLERACGITLVTRGGTLVLQHRRWRIEIPCDAIADVVPWIIPLPAGGVWLRLRSGRRFGHGIQVDDPVAFTEALVRAGAPDGIGATTRRWPAPYTRAKRDSRGRWDHPVLKFVVFGLVPALPLFRLHQWVAYGGTFGEYYSYGLKAYLLALAIFWGTYAIYLVLYAALLRAVVETVAVVATFLAPARATTLRRVVEIADRVLYYGGVPALLIRLFLAS